MMVSETERATAILEHIVEALDIPPSHYEKATKRYESLGEWLHRPQSGVREFDPEVYAQGSFRYGTVIRPLFQGEEYDLDLVCQLRLSKELVSQAKVKGLVGEELKDYATAHSMDEAAQEKNRCWRLEYADDVNFHMDILPAVPDDNQFVLGLARKGVAAHLAQSALAITDKRLPGYDRVQPEWPRSNPKGFAAWFEERMRVVAQRRMRELVAAQHYASVDKVPAYDWKTPLQRAIQILKRHRDVMFKDTPSLRPISMIITTLSAQAYQGESDLYEALSNILERMPGFVNAQPPRVPNPVQPDEDFADKWSANPLLRKSFSDWHAQAKADLNRLLLIASAADLDQLIRRRFEAPVDGEGLRRLLAQTCAARVSILSSPPVVIKSAPKPWGHLV